MRFLDDENLTGTVRFLDEQKTTRTGTYAIANLGLVPTVGRSGRASGALGRPRAVPTHGSSPGRGRGLAPLAAGRGAESRLRLPARLP